jgi:hypothetical protein
MPLTTPKAHARLQVPEQDRDEDVDRRDQQGGTDSQEQGVANGEHADAGRDGADQRAEPVDGQSGDEAPFAAELVGQLAARDHEGGHDQEKQGNADLHRLDGGVQVGLDVVDHDVHVRAGETADELRQRQRHQHLPQRCPVQLGNGAGHRRTPPRSRRPVTLGDGSRMYAMQASVPWTLTRRVTRHG